jgi:nicotinate-nucleotide adenylyltransferase
LVKGTKPVAAIFGGSFDPPHRGHQQIVQEVSALPDIDRLLVVPAYLNPFKQTSLASAKQRLQWCHRLFDGIPKVSVESYEVDQGRSVTTWESVNHFDKTYDVRYLIIGTDNLPTLHQWHNFEALNQRVTWLIATREGYALQTEGLRSWKLLKIDLPASSTRIRNNKEINLVDTRIEETVKEILYTKTKENPS